MAGKNTDDQYSDEEATRRMNEALRRALTSPPKPHSEMKIGKRRATTSPKTAPASGQTKHANARKAKIRNNSPH
jgi:hypothetical protein